MRSPSCEPTVDAGLRTPALSRRRSRARYLLILAEYGCLSVLATRFQQSFPHSSQTSDSKPDREDRFSDGPCVPSRCPWSSSHRPRSVPFGQLTKEHPQANSAAREKG